MEYMGVSEAGKLVEQSQDARISRKVYPYFSGLSGTRIAVYRYPGGIRDDKRNVATLGGVFLIEGRYLSLTAAHVFFDNIESFSSETPPPKISGIYEVVIENGPKWDASQLQ